MSVLFCSSPHLCMLEMQMQQPPGYRPRGGGISVMNEAEWKSRGNYSEIVDCVISRMQMEHLKRRVREIFPGTGEEIIFHDRKHRKDFYSLLQGRRAESLCLDWKKTGTDMSGSIMAGKRSTKSAGFWLIFQIQRWHLRGKEIWITEAAG